MVLPAANPFGAVAAPPAAAPYAVPGSAPANGPFGAIPQPPNPAAYAPVPGSEGVAPGTAAPPPYQQGAQPQTIVPQIDPTTGQLVAPAPAQPDHIPVPPDQLRQLAQQAQIGAQLAEEVQRLGQAQQRQQQVAAAQNEAEARLEQAYQYAERLEPNEAMTYLRNFHRSERARYEGEIERVRSDEQQSARALLERATAPMYAQHLAQSNGLPPQYAQRLSMLSPYDMDTYIPVLVQEYRTAMANEQRYQELVNYFNQFNLGNLAQQAAQQQPAPPGGSNGSPLPPIPANLQNGIQAGTREHLLSLPGVAAAFGIRG